MNDHGLDVVPSLACIHSAFSPEWVLKSFKPTCLREMCVLRRLRYNWELLGRKIGSIVRHHGGLRRKLQIKTSVYASNYTAEFPCFMGKHIVPVVGEMVQF